MKNTLTLIALLLLLGASTATAQTEHNITPPSGEGWEVPEKATSGSTVTIKYTGNKYVKSVKIKRKYPDNCVPGVFSVSATKKVYFSKGNLQYQPSSNTWRFADKQYTLLDANTSDHTTTSYTPTSEDWIDLFGWGMWLDEITDKTKITNTSTTDSQYAPVLTADNEFAENHRTVYGEQWFTLSTAEWRYLFNYSGYTNSTRAGKYGEGKVNGINGVILLPDDWTYPTDLSASSTSADDFKSGSSSWSNSYTAEDWVKMETAGAVFLPAAGSRLGTSVYYVGSVGGSWSSTANSEADAYVLCDVDPAHGSYRCGGISVRLVRGL